MNDALKNLCEVYKSPKDSEMFLYVRKLEGLARVPEALLAKFGKPALAMTLLLKDGRKLARVDVEKVKQSLDERGYFLQLPPAKDDYMTEINKHNSKLV